MSARRRARFTLALLASLAAACGEAAEMLSSRALAEALANVPQDAPALPLVSPLASETNAAVLEARFVERLGPGLPLPARGDDEVMNSMWLRRLVESSRLGWFQLEARGEPFEVQESLFSAS